MKRTATAFILLAVFSASMYAQMPRSDKRGVGTNEMGYRKNFEVLNPGLSWIYNWSYQAPSQIQSDFEDINLEYVPMVWGGGIDNEVSKDRIRAYLREHPSIRYILGFNEPNFTSQSHLTPTQAAAQWPHIEQIADEFGLTIVGPALNYAPANGAVSENGKVYTNPFDWYDAFFTACPDCRVDHIAIHLYMPEGGMKPVIDQLKKYNRPIWLTEFNRNDGTSNSTAEDHLNFITSEVEYLEKEPAIFRYAWFMTYSRAYAVNLLDLGEGNLTELGKVYVAMSSFDSSYYHPCYSRIPAVQYQSCGNVKLRVSTDDPEQVMLKDISNGSWAEYQVTVPEGGIYDITLRMACKTNTKIEFYEDDVLVHTYQPEATGEFTDWSDRHTSIPLRAGEHRLKVRSAGRMFYLEWLSVGNAPDGIEAVPYHDLSTHKRIDNGHLVIEHNGALFTPIGQRIH